LHHEIFFPERLFEAKNCVFVFSEIRSRFSRIFCLNFIGNFGFDSELFLRLFRIFFLSLPNESQDFRNALKGCWAKSELENKLIQKGYGLTQKGVKEKNAY
jgi:hypothetical protein